MAADVVPPRPLGDLRVGRVGGVARPRVAGAARVSLDRRVGAVAAVAAPAAASRATAGPGGGRREEAVRRGFGFECILPVPRLPRDVGKSCRCFSVS